MSSRSIYERELQEILKVWIFNFVCSNCIQSENEPSWFRYVSPMIFANDEDGTYPNSPTIWCGCNEMLYSIQSHGLYDLLDSLFERDKRTGSYIIIKLREPVDEEELESFDYGMERM